MRTRLALAALLAACGSNAPSVQSPGATEAVHASGTRAYSTHPVPTWPADQQAHQLAALSPTDIAAVQACRPTTPVFTADSVGPLHVGQRLREVAAACPRSLASWDWGEEAIPEPALLVRLGAAVIELVFDDTLPDSRVSYVQSSDVHARTMAGVGPGVSITALEQAYGKPSLHSAECVVAATFATVPGLSFRIDLNANIECPDVERLDGSAGGLPREARVGSVLAYRGHER